MMVTPTSRNVALSILPMFKLSGQSRDVMNLSVNVLLEVRNGNARTHLFLRNAHLVMPHRVLWHISKA